MNTHIAPRTICFASLVLVSLVVFWEPLRMLISFAFRYEHYSHIVLVPAVSLGLVWLERKRIFSSVRWSYGAGGGLILLGVTGYFFAQQRAPFLSQNDLLSATVLSIVVLWLGAYLFCYGAEALRRAGFSALFLFFLIPIPELALEKTILVLQKGSAEVAYGLFNLTGVPIYREGFLFTIPGLTIEVAEECSGIRSSIALLITSLLAGHVFLGSAWRKALLSLVVFPVVLLKNALRITTLSLLAVYVDPSFLSGWLHRKGGMVFFAFSLIVLAPVLWWLQRSELRTKEFPVSGGTKESSLPA